MTAPPPKVFMDWPRVPLGMTLVPPLLPMENNLEANVPTLIL